MIRHSMRCVLVLAAVLVTGLTACKGDGEAHRMSARESLAHGRNAARTWMSAATTGDSIQVGAQTAIALGYMERLRLGLGSPFRLIDYAVQDPRLADSTRNSLAWALLARTLDGDSYEIDAAALDRGGAAGIMSWPGLGERHLKLITDAIDDALDARSGELAVRLGYALAATEGSLPLHAPRYAATAAALLRDRELAMEDARDIVRVADAQRVDAVKLVQQWRTDRTLRVEAPSLVALTQDEERDALMRASRIASELRALGADAPSITAHHPASVSIRASLLSPAVARILLEQADSLRMPPLAPLVVGARGYDRELVAQPWLTADERTHRRGLETAGSEERFAARYAMIERVTAFDVVPSLVAMWSAVGMRSMSQEPVWYPGYAAPSARKLTQWYGLKSVTFGPSVPVSWRPYYRRMVDIALSDMQLVMPALNVRGLSIRFQEVGRDAGTLALHDPQQRRLLLPPSTAAGTLAHEIAHDLDWQVALKRYHVRGDYASDRAVRIGSAQGDRLALRMQDLAVGSTAPVTSSSRLAIHARRPTEILARNIDFFVTASLAEHGLVDGYLSSVEDEVLTGYGTVRAPELNGIAADALIRILDQIAPVPSQTREWFLHSYGTSRSLHSYDLARRVLEADIPDAKGSAAIDPAGDARVFDDIARTRSLGDRAIDAGICRAPGGAYNIDLENARRALVTEAAAARARGYAVRRARALMGRRAAQWVAGQLYGARWHVEGVSPEMEAYLGGLVDGARRAAATPTMSPRDGFALATPSAQCETMMDGLKL